MSEPVIETFWIEIPCKDEATARIVAVALSGFNPRISVHKVSTKNGEVHTEYDILEEVATSPDP